MELNTTWSEDTELLLPKITSLIHEGLITDPKDREQDFKLFRSGNENEPGGLHHRFRRPSLDSANNEILISKSPGISDGGRAIRVTHHKRQMSSVRTFIGGLSHHYNNLLMGIWGNISLMGMSLEKNHPAQKRLRQIEALIQNGSSLIYLLFGYLIERRTTAKKLRLNQLIQEIKTYNKVSGNDIDFSIIEASAIELSKIRNKTQLASCMARVMNQMLTMVQEKRNFIDAHDCLDLLKSGHHLDKIDALLLRGFEMIRKLDYYAENIRPQKKPICLKSIVQHQIQNAKQRQVTITQDLSADIPSIRADYHQILYAFEQLVDNALDAVDGDGDIHVQLDTLKSESPKDRCGVHMLKNYAVMTISDNGRGMATSVQAKIFDPFFTEQNGNGKYGLGLAAAAGIIKAHGGYIQVRSKAGCGSILKIYLP